MSRLDIDRLLVAWTAGFFDGEGCVMIQGQASGSLSVAIALGQKVREPLDRVQARWGGTVRLSYESRTNRHADKYDWRLSGAAAIAFLVDIRPFLVVKDRQADVAIEYGETMAPKPRGFGRGGVPPLLAQRRLALQSEIRRLNHRGRAVA